MGNAIFEFYEDKWNNRYIVKKNALSIHWCVCEISTFQVVWDEILHVDSTTNGHQDKGSMIDFDAEFCDLTANNLCPVVKKLYISIF